MASDSEHGATEQAQAQGGRDPVRNFTRFVFLFLLILFAWYVLADRLAPWTDQARVQSFVVPITPKVSGKVKQVAVVDNQLVAHD